MCNLEIESLQKINHINYRTHTCLQGQQGQIYFNGGINIKKNRENTTIVFTREGFNTVSRELCKNASTFELKSRVEPE